jgi:NADH:ubiquinone oxidoreductase subunit F (NADH-binding)
MLKKGADRERILPLLQEHGGLDEDNVRKVARETGVPEADVWGAGSFYTLLRHPGPRQRVCNGLTCRMFGADDVIAALKAEGKAVEAVSCLGQCDRAPASLDHERRLVHKEEGPRAVTPADAELPMNLAGADDASYAALARAREIGADAVIAQLEASGLQGRGGAGFPAHLKWKSVRSQAEIERYVVCNADEGEPGTFKDRECMLRRPHRVLEGLAITAFTAGAKDIYIYIRGEFLDERDALERALAEAREQLADFAFHIVLGHGAYICGEETALLESLEGKRGMPRLKPPYPTEHGFRGKPTLMHNVETVACVPSIILRGGDWFRSKGRTEAGSKLYCISGHVNVPGVYELPLGVSLDELVEAAGGYLGTPHAFSPGGASSGFLPMGQRTLPLDYANLAKAGSMLGSAGVVVINDSIDMAHATAWQLEFFEEESCGQCAPCRIGTRYLQRQVERFLHAGSPDALSHVADVGWEMEEGSICGLGMVAMKPLQSALEHFPEAFAPRQPSESEETS